jgi:hypothetical protein
MAAVFVGAAAAAGVSVAATGTGVVVAVSPPQADNNRLALTSRLAANRPPDLRKWYKAFLLIGVQTLRRARRPGHASLARRIAGARCAP